MKIKSLTLEFQDGTTKEINLKEAEQIYNELAALFSKPIVVKEGKTLPKIGDIIYTEK